MKTRIFMLFLPFAFLLSSCTSNNNGIEERIDTSELYKIEPSLKYHITKEIPINISFGADTTTIINDKQITTIVNWCKKIKQDSILAAAIEGRLENNYIVQILGIVTPNTSYRIVEKRLKNIQYYIDNTLGIHLRGEIPVFDVLYSFEYSEKEQNTIVLGINIIHYKHALKEK